MIGALTIHCFDHLTTFTTELKEGIRNFEVKLNMIDYELPEGRTSRLISHSITGANHSAYHIVYAQHLLNK